MILDPSKWARNINCHAYRWRHGVSTVLLILRFRKPRFWEGCHPVNMACTLYSRYPTHPTCLTVHHQFCQDSGVLWKKQKTDCAFLVSSLILLGPFIWIKSSYWLSTDIWVCVDMRDGWEGIRRTFTKVPHWSFGVEYAVFFLFPSVRPFFFSVAPLSVVRPLASAICSTSPLANFVLNIWYAAFQKWLSSRTITLL